MPQGQPVPPRIRRGRWRPRHRVTADGLGGAEGLVVGFAGAVAESLRPSRVAKHSLGALDNHLYCQLHNSAKGPRASLVRLSAAILNGCYVRAIGTRAVQYPVFAGARNDEIWRP